MSSGRQIPLDEALRLAREMTDELRPVVARVKVAGSVRRKRPLVSDIEICVEPRVVSADLFGATAPDVFVIRAVASRWGSIVKGGSRYIQVKLDSGVRVDLLLVHPPANWWVQLVIRTGPAPSSKEMVTRLYDHGRRCVGGRIITAATGDEYPVNSEEDVFAAAGMPFLPPVRRSALVPFT